MWVPYIYLSTGETWLLWHVPSVSGPYLDCGEQVVKACATALRFFQWCRWEHVIPGCFPVHLLGMITEVEAKTHYIDITGEVQGKRGCSNPLDAKRVPLNSFSKLSLWISWTLVEVDYSKQWWFQAFFHRFSKRSLAHKSNSTAPRNHSGIPGGLQALCQVGSSLYLVMFSLECFPGTLGCSSHSTQMDTAFVYLILLVKSDFLKWPNFSKDGRSIDAVHVLKWMFIKVYIPMNSRIYRIYHLLIRSCKVHTHLQLGNVDSSRLLTPLWGNITCILYLVYPCYIPDIVGCFNHLLPEAEKPSLNSSMGLWGELQLFLDPEVSPASRRERQVMPTWCCRRPGCLKIV